MKSIFTYEQEKLTNIILEDEYSTYNNRELDYYL